MTSVDTPLSSEINGPSETPHPRQDWEAQYQRMAENGDDALLDADIFTLTEWDEAEWEW